MHSRMFQLSRKPINTEDYIDESDYYEHWFTNEIADYVANSNREYDIEWLSGQDGIVIDKDTNGEYLKVINKKEYFQRSFITFKKNIEKIQDCTLDTFVKGFPQMWAIKNAYERRFEFYITTYEDGVETLDSFVRNCDENVKYYIGGTLDYHH